MIMYLKSSRNGINFETLCLPGLHQRVAKVKQGQEKRFNERKQSEILQPGTRVMSVDSTHASKWNPVYEGPYTVLQQPHDGSYSLQDDLGQELSRHRTIEMLKVVNKDKLNSKPTNQSQSFAVEKILDHQTDGAHISKWKGILTEELVDKWLKLQQPAANQKILETAGSYKKQNKLTKTSSISSLFGLGGSDVRFQSVTNSDLPVTKQLADNSDRVIGSTPKPVVSQLAWKRRLRACHPQSQNPLTPSRGDSG